MKVIAHGFELNFHNIFTQAPVNFAWPQAQVRAQVCPGVAMQLHLLHFIYQHTGTRVYAPTSVDNSNSSCLEQSILTFHSSCEPKYTVGNLDSCPPNKISTDDFYQLHWQFLHCVELESRHQCSWSSS